MRFALQVTLVLCCAWRAEAETAEKPLRLLLAAGQNTGLPSEVVLKYAEQDAAAYAQVMRRYGHIQPGNLVLLRDASRESIQTAIERFTRRAAAHSGDTILFFYYSGHADNQSLHLRGQRLNLAELEAALNGVNAKLRVAVIDACRSEDDTQAKGFGRSTAFSLKLKAPNGMKGVVTVRSSSEGEQSQESSNLRGAVFSHYFLTALRGAADHDHDQQVSLNEAYTYAYRQTVQRSAASSGNVMHPSVELNIEGVGALIMTQTADNLAQVVLPREADTRYLVYERRSGAVRAEVWADPSRELRIPVPSGQYLIQRRQGARSGAMVLALEENESKTVKPSGFRSVPETVLAAKGGRLRLVHHEIRAGYSPTLSASDRWMNRLYARYGLGMITWTVSAGFELGQVEYNTQDDRRTERHFGGDLRLEWRRVLRPLDLHIGALWRVISQELFRQDANLAAAAGYLKQTTFTGMAVGPMVGLSWRYDLDPNWAISVGTTASSTFVKEGDAWALRPEFGLELGFVTEF
ncbi:MAG: caspase family protein [Myxococcota bacterium]|nr:caspase family protein [Myxococcota bacterium]